MFLQGLIQLLGKLFFFSSSISNRSSFPPPLSSEEESECFARMWQGDAAAKDKLIQHNLRLVAHIVKKYSHSAESDDLISVGTIGLIKAINTYRSDKGTAFATFAARCIENEILMLLRAGKKYKNTLSLSESVGNDKDGNELTLMDLLFVGEEGVFQQVENNLLREKLLKLLKENLTEREDIIICHRYGLGGKQPLTQREIAKMLKISRSYISRIEKKALQKIREHMDREKFGFE